MIKRFGKLIAASFIVMAIGIVTFLLVIPLYGYFGIDTDIIGLIIICIGLVICIIGIIHKYELRGFKLVSLVVLAAVLSLPVLMLIMSLIHYLMTNKSIGE
jgi:hypothetical protein